LYICSMIMKKINDRLYEFFELDPEDDNREITDVIPSELEEDYSWLYNSLDEADFDLLFEDSVDDNYIDVDYEDVSTLIDHEDVEVITKPKSKKDELIDSLNYLKSKPFKTKQDHESIYTLGVVLNNMK